MKLLLLKIKNINSLKGEHLIDFSIPPLSNNFIFLITGPTGSGKTTILDCILTALFDKTPRLTTKGGTKALKSQGCDNAYIELSYTIDNKIYKHIWEIDKKNNKKITIYENEKLLNGIKINDLANKTKEFIGLDYDSFLKTVILAQNKFDEFIKSKPEERRQIIESITNTTKLEEIKDIINSTYNEFKEKFYILKQKLDLLNEQLSKIDIITLKDELNQKKLMLKNEKLNLEKNLKLQSELLELQKLFNELTKLKDEYDKLIKNYDFENIKKEIDFLKLIRNEFYDLIFKINNINNLIENKRQELNNNQNKLNEISQKLVLNQEKQRILNIQFDEFLKEYDEKIKKLISAKHYFDELVQINEDCEVIDKEINELKIKQNKLNNELLKLKSEKTLKINEKEKLQNQSKDYQEFSNTEQNFYTFSEKIKNIKLLNEEIIQLDNKIQENLSKITQNNKQIQIILEKLSNLKLSEQQLLIKKNELENIKKELSNKYEENIINNASLILKSKLKIGDVCPICENIVNHDLKLDTNLKLDNKLENYKNQILEIENQILNCDKNLNQLIIEVTKNNEMQNNITLKNKELSEEIIFLNEKKEKINLQIQNIQLNLNIPLKILNDTNNQKNNNIDYDELLKKWQQCINFLLELEKNLSKIEQEITLCDEKIRFKENEILNLNQQINMLNEKLDLYKKRKDEKLKTIYELCGENDISKINIKIQELENKKKNFEVEKKNIEQIVNNNLITKTTIENLLKSLNEELNKLNEDLKNLNQIFNEKLINQNLNYETIILKYEEINKLNSLESTYNQKVLIKNQLETAIKLTNEKINAREFNNEKLVELTKIIETNKEIISNLEREIGAIESKINDYNETLKMKENVQIEFEKNCNDYNILEELYLLTKDNQFRDFVLSFHLKNLLAISNQYLKILTLGRYELNFNFEVSNVILVKDYLNNGLEREINTLSGGESFLVSLSLAIGLSLISAGNKLIEFMFLDEGFGTLDNEVLSEVLNMLVNLKNIGRKIGIISHIQQVKEQIETKIELVKNDNGLVEIKIC